MTTIVILNPKKNKKKTLTIKSYFLIIREFIICCREYRKALPFFIKTNLPSFRKWERWQSETFKIFLVSLLLNHVSLLANQHRLIYQIFQLKYSIHYPKKLFSFSHWNQISHIIYSLKQLVLMERWIRILTLVWWKLQRFKV